MVRASCAPSLRHALLVHTLQYPIATSASPCALASSSSTQLIPLERDRSPNPPPRQPPPAGRGHLSSSVRRLIISYCSVPFILKGIYTTSSRT
eukprot:scaffold14720_cov29-Tisochrysis_lutea.AAC.3